MLTTKISLNAALRKQVRGLNAAESAAENAAENTRWRRADATNERSDRICVRNASSVCAAALRFLRGFLRLANVSLTLRTQDLHLHAQWPPSTISPRGARCCARRTHYRILLEEMRATFFDSR